MDPRRKVTSGSRALIFTTEKNSSPIVIGPSSEPKLFKKGTKIEKSDFSAKKMVPGVLAASPDCFSSDGDQCLFIYQDRKDPEVDFSIGAGSGRNGIGFFRDSEIIDSR